MDKGSRSRESEIRHDKAAVDVIWNSPYGQMNCVIGFLLRLDLRTSIPTMSAGQGYHSPAIKD